MTVADLLPALQDVKSGRLSIDQLIAACTAWSDNPNRPLAEVLGRPSDVPLATAVDDLQATTDHVPAGPGDSAEPPGPATGGQYVPTRLFARGGMGQVWLARDPLDREVAFKDLRPERSANRQAVSRFVREGALTGLLEHPGIVPVYSAGKKADGGPFYAMRLVRGRTLTDAIREAHIARQDFTSPKFRDLLNSFVAVCNAVAFAHSKGIIHRDLKPANVMVGDFGEVQVMDWGLAKRTGEGGMTTDESDGFEPLLTHAGAIVGTPAYMAPEQAAGEPDEHDERTDVFGLGAILYEILTGKAPFASHQEDRGNAIPPRRRNPSVPAALEAICLRATAVRGGARYQSAQALAADVRRWLADEAVSARRDAFPVRAMRWGRQHRTFVSTAAAALVVATIGLGIGFAEVSRVNGKLDTANSQLKSANSDLQTANTNLEAAHQTSEARRQQAESAREQSDKVAALIFDTLRQEDPNIGGAKSNLVERLVRTEKIIDQDPSLEPSIRVRVYSAVALTFGGIGRPSDAVRVHQKAWDLARQRLPACSPQT